ncbi:hypothetical protein JCM3774_002973 [Rhodotorula dairenensis]
MESPSSTKSNPTAPGGSAPSAAGETYALVLARQASACEQENERLRAEIAAIEAELAQPVEVDERATRGTRRLRDLEYTVAHLEATFWTIEDDRFARPRDHLLRRNELVVEQEAFVQLADSVSDLEQALAWTDARKLDEDALLERDRVYLNDAESMYAVFAERIAQAQAEPLPAPPDGREIVFRTRRRLDELDRRFDFLQTGLQQLIDHVLVDEGADERFDPLWVEANVARRRWREAARERCGSGSETTQSVFDLRRYMRGEDDLVPPSSSMAADVTPDAAATATESAVPERAREFKLLLETLLNRSIEKTATGGLAFAAGNNNNNNSAAVDDFFETDAPDALVDFVVRAGIAEEAAATAAASSPAEQEEEETRKQNGSLFRTAALGGGGNDDSAVSRDREKATGDHKDNEARVVQASEQPVTKEKEEEEEQETRRKRRIRLVNVGVRIDE